MSSIVIANSFFPKYVNLNLVLRDRFFLYPLLFCPGLNGHNYKVAHVKLTRILCEVTNHRNLKLENCKVRVISIQFNFTSKYIEHILVLPNLNKKQQINIL